MTQPGGSDRIQQDVPTASGTGDNGDLGTDPDAGGAGERDGVPLTRDAAIRRDAATDDEQPARPGTDPSLAQRADPDTDD